MYYQVCLSRKEGNKAQIGGIDAAKVWLSGCGRVPGPLSERRRQGRKVLTPGCNAGAEAVPFALAVDNRASESEGAHHNLDLTPDRDGSIELDANAGLRDIEDVDLAFPDVGIVTAKAHEPAFTDRKSRVRPSLPHFM